MPQMPEKNPDDSTAGKQARKLISRHALGSWEPAANRADPVATLVAQEADRVADLVPIRYQRMSASAFAFYRGAAAIMALDLGARDHTDLQVQLCGDAHLANFGGFATPDRQLVFDLNDFDETLPGPFEWDIARLVASFEIAGRHRGFGTKQTTALIELVADTYVKAITDLAGRTRMEVWYTRLSAQDILARWGKQATPEAIERFNKLLAKGESKTSSRAVSRYTEVAKDGNLDIISQPPLLVPVRDLPESAQFGDVNAWMAKVIEGYRESLEPDREALVAGYELIDAARKVVGVGSVGTRCWIGLLIALDDHSDDLVLQSKQAGPSVYEAVLPKTRYANYGERVVAGQRLVQAASDVLLGWTRLADTHGRVFDFYVRQMWDWKTSVDLDTMEYDAFRIYAQICGWTLARAHARSGPRKAIAAYLGSGKAFTDSMVEFAGRYADQNQHDYEALQAAIAAGRIKVAATQPTPRGAVDL